MHEPSGGILLGAGLARILAAPSREKHIGAGQGDVLELDRGDPFAAGLITSLERSVSVTWPGHASIDCVGVCIEEPLFSGQFSSVKALFPMLGAAV